VKVDETPTLQFGNLEIVNLGDGLQVPLGQSSCFGQRTTNALDGVVP
jgi:hypothetical protein